MALRRVALWAYKPGSRSARALTTALDIPIIRHEGSRFRPHGKTIINWGGSTIALRSFSGIGRVINEPAEVRRAGNKLAFFNLCKASENGPNIPEFSEEILDANAWLNAGKTIVSRQTLTGHSGRGIVITEAGGTIPPAPLYVQYIKKSHEFRVHLFNFEGVPTVVDVQRKIRDPDREPTDWRVRSHANGFIFVRNELEVPPEVLAQARLGFQAAGLDFGAVDVVYSNRSTKAWCLEINTAPGLEGRSVDIYAEAFTRALQERTH